MAGKLNSPILGAVTGAVLVAAIAGVVGVALQEPPHIALLGAFVLVGAVLGAYAWGVVAYERVREIDELSTEYRYGALAEAEPEPERQEPETASEPEAESGLGWLARRRAGSRLKLPLNP